LIYLVLPRLYELLCEEKTNENDDDGDEADSNNIVKRHRSLTTGKIIYISDFLRYSEKVFSNNSM